MSHFLSAFLSAAAHSVVPHLFSAFFCPFAGHWAVAVAAAIKAAAIIVIIVFILLILPFFRSVLNLKSLTGD